jgi:hypothetical protein
MLGVGIDGGRVIDEVSRAGGESRSGGGNMTEAEWLAGAHPEPMLGFLLGK